MCCDCPRLLAIRCRCHSLMRAILSRAGSEQWLWLRNDLSQAARRSRWIVVMGHRPMCAASFTCGHRNSFQHGRFGPWGSQAFSFVWRRSRLAGTRRTELMAQRWSFNRSGRCFGSSRWRFLSTLSSYRDAAVWIAKSSVVCLAHCYCWLGIGRSMDALRRLACFVMRLFPKLPSMERYDAAQCCLMLCNAAQCCGFMLPFCTMLCDASKANGSAETTTH